MDSSIVPTNIKQKGWSSAHDMKGIFYSSNLVWKKIDSTTETRNVIKLILMTFNYFHYKCVGHRVILRHFKLFIQGHPWVTSQIREQMSGPDLHIFTLKFLALEKTGFPP